MFGLACRDIYEAGLMQTTEPAEFVGPSRPLRSDLGWRRLVEAVAFSVPCIGHNQRARA